MTQPFLNLVPTMMGATLLSENIPNRKRKKKRGLLHQGMYNIAGLGMIKATAETL